VRVAVILFRGFAAGSNFDAIGVRDEGEDVVSRDGMDRLDVLRVSRFAELNRRYVVVYIG